ncbi:MAG TPA: NAD(P)/FAD-dependent oxidoreductase, partial [Terriglobia bacterium]|nr:NAD(P)/FAD-dependent oxidoreductase [Terriglobia bacterium]
GTCALRGCDPKKVLVGASEAVDRVRRMKGKGVESGAGLEWRELIRFKRSFTDPVPKQREESFAKAGITAFHGRARFIDATTVEVGEHVLKARRVVVAAGAKPARLKIRGEDLLTTSEQFLELDVLPRRITFVGGGYISFEFAHVAARAGAKVTLLHRDAQPLPGFDPDLVSMLVEWSRELSIDIQLETTVEEIEKTSRGLTVHASSKDKRCDFEADMAVHGAGRTPDIEDLGLDAAGVDWNERKGVKVNEYMQSVSNPVVYAAGDAAASGGPPLTPVAAYEGGIVAANLLKGNHAKPSYLGTPTVVYTTPPLAAVGLQQKAAREQGRKFRVNHAETSEWYSSRRIGEKCSGYKVLVEEGSNRIIGAHLLGFDSEDVINIFAMAIRLGIVASQLKEMIFTYPTRCSDLEYML